MSGDAVVLKTVLARLVRRRSAACSRFAQFFRTFYHCLRAPGKPVDLAHAAFLLPRLVLVECGVDAAQGRLKRDARLAPCLNQCPVERGEQQQCPAALVETVFDLREVIEIILQARLSASWRGLAALGCARRESPARRA